MPVLGVDIFDDGEDRPGPLAGKLFGLMLEALDSLKPGALLFGDSEGVLVIPRQAEEAFENFGVM